MGCCFFIEVTCFGIIKIISIYIFSITLNLEFFLLWRRKKLLFVVLLSSKGEEIQR